MAGVLSWLAAGCLGGGLLVSGGVPGVGVRGVVQPYRSEGILGITTQIMEMVTTEQQRLGDGGGGVILVYGDPALFFQLRLGVATGQIGDQRLPPTVQKWGVAPVGELSFVEQGGGASGPIWLVVGPQGSRDAKVQEFLKAHPERARSMAIFGYQGSDYVLLDQFSADELEKDSLLRRQTVQLYLVGGKESGPVGR